MQSYELQANLAIWAQRLGVPVPQFLDAARWLLGKGCSFCNAGTQILRRVNELGEERTAELITQILEAKKRQDFETLEKIKASVEG